MSGDAHTPLAGKCALSEKVKTGRTGKSGKSTFASFSAFVAFYFFRLSPLRQMYSLLCGCSLLSCHSGAVGLIPLGPQRLIQALIFLSPIFIVLLIFSTSVVTSCSENMTSFRILAIIPASLS